MFSNFIQQLVSATYIFKDEYSLNPYKLEFYSDQLEKEYVDDKYVKSQRIIQLSIVFGLLAIVLFGILDYFLAPQEYKDIWKIRYGFMMPATGCIIWATISKKFIKKTSHLNFLVLFYCPLSVLAMIAVAPSPAAEYYYAGLLIIIFYPHLLRTNFVTSLFSNIWIITGYNFIVLYVNPLSEDAIINNNFFLVTYCFMGCITNYIQDLYVRIEFVSSKLLERSKAAIEELFLEAHASNKAKGQFLAVVSHELRTPLNAIIGFSDVLSTEMFGKLGHEKYLEYAKDINNSGQHLLQLITDIMEVSRIDAGKVVLDSEILDVNEEIIACKKMVGGLASEHGVSVEYVPTAEKIHLMADQRTLRQCLNNILTNAVKFTPDGGNITINCFEDEKSNICFAITDTGKGIKPEHIENVFEPFTQVQSAYNREHEGLGLGLPLVRKLMRLHDGDVAIDSTVDVGTKVILWFPAKRNGKEVDKKVVEQLEKQFNAMEQFANVDTIPQDAEADIASMPNISSALQACKHGS